MLKCYELHKKPRKPSADGEWGTAVSGRVVSSRRLGFGFFGFVHFRLLLFAPQKQNGLDATVSRQSSCGLVTPGPRAAQSLPFATRPASAKHVSETRTYS